MRRVVITGLGALTPVANGARASWDGLVAGRSGIERITLFDPSPYSQQLAGEVKNFDNSSIDAKEVRHMDRYTQLALVATQEALADSGYTITPENAPRTGVVIGSAVGGVTTLLAQQKVLEERGQRRLSPFFLSNMLADSATGQVAIATGAQGHNMAVVSACATGGHAIGEAFETIRRDDADVMLAGGAEAPIVPLIHAGFITMRALADDPDPHRASKPFHLRRNGFIMSEGAAMLVVEELAHARARGAHIYAEIIGYGSSNDAYHMAAQVETGAGAQQAMEMALRKARIAVDQSDYINAHGTGTPINDRVETAAIKKVLGEHAYRVAISSTKSMTGHMMGAAGAVEALVCAWAIEENCIPGTINLDEPDPDLDLDYTPIHSRGARVDVALSNSIGLGGHNSCLILRRVSIGDEEESRNGR